MVLEKPSRRRRVQGRMILASVVLLCSSIHVDPVQVREERHSGFGRAIAQVPDLDGDGIREVVIADSQVCPVGSAREDGSSVFVYSPGEGKVLRRIEGVDGLRPQRYSIAAVEDEEGRLCIASLCRREGESLILLHDPRTGELRSRVSIDTRGGVYIAERIWSLGDADGEPGTEVVVDCWKELPPPPGREPEWAVRPGRIAVVISLAKQSELRSGAEGCDVVGDVDGDGVADYVQLHREDRLTAISGKSGEVFFEVPREKCPAGEFLHFEYFRGPDGDADGHRDIVQAAYHGSYAHEDQAGYQEIWGSLRLLSGKDGSELWSSRPTTCTGLMWMTAATLTDRDGDGVEDLCVTYSSEVTTLGNCPGWDVLSGKTGERLRHTSWSELPGFSGIKGYALAEGDDLDGDGVPQVWMTRACHVTSRMEEGEVLCLSVGKGLLARVSVPRLREEPPGEER